MKSKQKEKTEIQKLLYKIWVILGFNKGLEYYKFGDLEIKKEELEYFLKSGPEVRG